MPRTTVHPSARTTAAGLAALALLLAGCSPDATAVRDVAEAAEPPAPASAPASVAPPATAPTPAPVPTSPAAPTAAPPSEAPTAAPRPSAPTIDVAALQRRLTELRYYAGEVDGRSGPATRSAVMAFQKVNGLTVDGTVGPRTRAALASPRTPVLRKSSPADRVEVDLDRQVLYVVEDGQIARIMPVSSGNGETYRQKDGGRARALTPVGTYRIERRIVGVRNADLGTLYDPQYFYRGWAIHGSDSVPAGPASHGCVRVTRADAKALLRLIDVGTTVHLYGGTHVFSAGSQAAGTSTPSAG